MLILVLMAVNYGCRDDSSQIPPLPTGRLSPVVVKLDTTTGYAINALTGDSVKPLLDKNGGPVATGKWRPLSTIVLDTIRLEPAKGVSYRWTFIVRTRIPSNAVLATSTRVPVIEKNLRHFRMGIDTSGYTLTEFDQIIPTGVPLPVTTKRVAVNIPESHEALEPTITKRGEYITKSLETYHGLKSAGVNSVISDSMGRLWIAHSEGLSCYDGKLIRHYTTENGMSDDRAYNLMEDRRGRIWINHGGGKISIFDGNGFDQLSFKTEPTGIFAGGQSFAEDREGNVWIRGLTTGVARFDGDSLTLFTRKEGLPGNSVRSVYTDSKGNLWIGTFRQGACRFDGREFMWFTQSDGLPYHTINSIVEDSKGNIWLGSDSGLARYDGKEMLRYFPENGLPFRMISSMAVDSTGLLWISSFDNGVCTFDGQQFVPMDKEAGLSGVSFNNLHVDRLGRTWTASDQGILLSYRDGIRRFALSPETLTSPASHMLSRKPGDIYFSDYHSGLLKYSGDSLFRCDVSGDPIKSESFTDLAYRRDEIWLAGNKGLVCLYQGKLYRINLTRSTSARLINSVQADKKERIWISTMQGVYTLDGDKLIGYAPSEPLSSYPTTRVFEDSKGRIWIGTNGAGVSAIQEQQSITFTEREGIASNNVMRITEDRTGRIWLNTGMNISVMADSTVTLLSHKKGMPFRFNYVEKHDSSGNAWVSNIGQIAKIPAYLIDNNQAARMPASENQGGITVFGDRDGIKKQLQGRVEIPGGKLLFLELGPGLPMLEIDINRIPVAGLPPTVHLEQAIVNKRLINFMNPRSLDSSGIQVDSVNAWTNSPSRIRLAYDQDDIDIYFSSTQQVYGDPHEYSFFMNGLSKSWSIPSKSNHVNFQRLAPGQYTLFVRAKNRSGVWGPASTMDLVIRPPWWQTGWAYLLYSLVAFVLVAGYIQWRTSSIRKRNTILEKQVQEKTGEYLQARDRAEKSLEELRSAQSLLIQSEKMASLGELTAGIAHEIQNPLNFVNNFSDLNAELSEEMIEALTKGDIHEAKKLAEDIKSNQEKIHEHGIRAGSIVKSMLLHSRGSTGQKESTDINKLCDEYLRLAFHGMRAKDKSFEVSIETSFDPSLGKPEVIPQDIGRVLLNVYNNAFYAVQARGKSGDTLYQPTLKVATSMSAGTAQSQTPRYINIAISDNGTGIPENIRSKIFQPFFTTKPTGQGTGLGLSLSFDIIKAHGGTLRADSTEGVGTEFLIQLPVSNPKG